MTAAKIAMIEASKSPSEEILEHLKDTLDSDLVTRKALQEKVRAAARSLGHEGVADRPGGVTRKLWRDLGSLRPDAKNGARYTIDTGQTEVRAVRNRDDWLAVDVSRNTQRIIDEVKKASSLVRSIN
jgi:CTP:molybdopterin cytidylyltransferase MocA